MYLLGRPLQTTDNSPEVLRMEQNHVAVSLLPKSYTNINPGRRRAVLLLDLI
jgi:hypothetical protein